MAKKFGFFNSINGDRKYLASDIAKAFDIGVSTGLKADKEDNLQIVPHENMIIKMLPGGAMIFGHYLLDEEEELITLDLADGELNRIDRVVLRYDKYERSIKTVVIKGTPALTPVAPAPLRTEEQFDLVLADIYVAKATTEVTESNITDMRNSELCGFIGVKGAVSQIDFDAHLADNASAHGINLKADKPVIGTNSNGTYTKYEDGRLECRATLTLNYQSAVYLARTGNLDWVYPASFVEIPDVFITKKTAGTTANALTKGVPASSPALSSATVRLYSTDTGFTSTDTIVVSVLAIGRWK